MRRAHVHMLMTTGASVIGSAGAQSFFMDFSRPSHIVILVGVLTVGCSLVVWGFTHLRQLNRREEQEFQRVEARYKTFFDTVEHDIRTKLREGV